MSIEFPSFDDAPEIEAVTAALEDAACREIVSALEEPKTAEEIAEETELPLSTTYRKLDRLVDATLIAETVGGPREPHQQARFVVDFERIAIDLSDDRRLRVRIERATDRVLGIWRGTPQES